MSERFSTEYKRLFEVRILHHYWLDEGGEVFDSLAENIRNTRLLNYDLRTFLSLMPTEDTAQTLKGLDCKFKATTLGFVVAAPKNIVLPSDAVFEFIMTVRSSEFFNYTSLTLRKQKIVELDHKPHDKIYRYKENVPTFSNETGTSKSLPNPPNPPNSPVTILFLSRPTPAFAVSTDYKAESFVGTLHQALQDHPPDAPPSAGWQTIENPSDHPIYVHQDDSSTLVPPMGLTGVPDRGIELTEGIPENIFALIKIKTLQPNNEFSLVQLVNPADPADPQKVELREPVFEIRFKNRTTIWQYYKKNKGKPKDPATPPIRETGPLSLTFFGNASPESLNLQKPSHGDVKVKFENNDPARIIERVISEIFE
jgi:hypothetical protein